MFLKFWISIIHFRVTIILISDIYNLVFGYPSFCLWMFNVLKWYLINNSLFVGLRWSKIIRERFLIVMIPSLWTYRSGHSVGLDQTAASHSIRIIWTASLLW